MSKEVVIEISAPNCANVMFTPLRKLLRGRWDVHKLPIGTSSEPGILNLRELPGMHVALDVQRREARVYDPMALPKNADALKAAQKVIKHATSREYHPEKETFYRNLSDDAIASFVYWMQRFIEQNIAVLVAGNFPSQDSLPGRIEVDPFNSGNGAKRFKDEFTRTRRDLLDPAESK